MSEPGGASVGIGGPTSASWREEALARVEGLTFLHALVSALPASDGLDPSFRRHLETRREKPRRESARRCSNGCGSALPGRRSSARSRTWTSPKWTCCGARRRPCWKALCRVSRPRQPVPGEGRSAPRGHRRAHQGTERALHPASAGTAPERALAANTQRRRNLARVRSFRTMLRGGIFAACLLTVMVGVMGLLWPAANPLCFTPQHGKEGFSLRHRPQTMTALGGGSSDASTRTSASRALNHVLGGDHELISADRRVREVDVHVRIGKRDHHVHEPARARARRPARRACRPRRSPLA